MTSDGGEQLNLSSDTYDNWDPVCGSVDRSRPHVKEPGAGAVARARGSYAALVTRESLVFAAWLITSMLAVAGALINGWLGFALALAGGVVTGILCLRARTNAPT